MHRTDDSWPLKQWIFGIASRIVDSVCSAASIFESARATRADMVLPLAN